MNELKKAAQWVNWKLEPGKDGKPTKLPKNARTGGNAQSNNPATWSSYELAEQQRGNYDGIGFMFANGICGIDIDGADDPARAAAAQEIIAHMDTYTELSPSGSGYHLIFRCDLTQIPQANGKLAPAYYQKNPHNGLECYFSGLTNRFFTYTGEAVNSLDIEDRTPQVLAFLDKHMKRNPPQRSNATEDGTKKDTSPSAFDILTIARKARNGNKFTALFDRGDISQYNGDDSSADIALCNILAFYAQGDPGEIDRLFRQSALMREKWERQDYRAMTIDKAIELCGGKYYKPRKKRGSASIDGPVIVHKWQGAIYINPFETPESRQRYAMNDIGAGNLFADTYQNVSRFVKEAQLWYVYDGRVWQPDVAGVIVAQQAKDLTNYMLDCRKYLDDDTAAESWVKFVAARMKRAARDTMLRDASSVYAVSIQEFDRNPYLLNCQNCTLDLQNFTAHSHRPGDLISKIANVTFDPKARCERWYSFINEIMQDDRDKAHYLQKALGYTLIGDTSEECFFILWGATTRNGKGTTMETTLHILGDYGRTAQPESIAQKQNTNSGGPSEDIARLRGARFVNMSEPDKGLRLNAALVKQLTGGDTVTARFLHQNSFEYRPEYKLFINTNYKPRTTDDSIFASGRVRLIEFNRHFNPTEQDTGLKAFFKQPENMSGILNWYIDGLKMKNILGFMPPQSVQASIDQYREESDTVGLFIKESLLAASNSKTPLKQIHFAYSQWCDSFGYSPMNSANLAQTLRAKGLKVERGHANKVYLFGYNVLMEEEFKYAYPPPEYAQTP